MLTMLEKLQSRKLWAAVVGTLIVTLGQNLGLDPSAVQWAAGIIAAYILGQSHVDAAAAKHQP
jgi:hypothetical protein